LAADNRKRRLAGKPLVSLQASRTLGRERQRMTELSQEDIERQEGDDHADCRVDYLFEFLNLFFLLLRRLLHATLHPAFTRISYHTTVILSVQ